jgi:hypothetical protein
VSGFLRFVGILNAAAWFGAALFLCFGAEPAVFSADTQVLLQKSFTYLAGLLDHNIRVRFFYLSLFFGVVALVHLVAEWLYLGRTAPRLSLWLLMGLLGQVLANRGLLEPRLKTLHVTRVVGGSVAERQAAQKSFSTLSTVIEIMDVFIVGGLAIYLWRMANPPDSLRFVSATKFRS